MQFLKKFKQMLFLLIVAFATTMLVGRALAKEADNWIPIIPGSESSEPIVTVIEETPQYLLIKYEISGFRIQTLIAEGTEYKRIHLGNSYNSELGEPGEPGIPLLNDLIQVPLGKSASASIVEADYVDVGLYNLYPIQTPGRDDGNPRPGFTKDKAAYESGKVIHENLAITGAVQGWGGIPVAGLSVSPVKYIPSTGRTEIASQMIVRVDFLAGGRDDITTSRNPAKYLLQAQSSSLLNPHLPDPHELDFDEDVPVRTLFILKEEALEASRPLIDFHHQTGLRAEVWLADDIEDEFEIRDRIIDLYAEGLEYVVIIGDGHVGDADVPMHLWDPEDPGWQDDESTASNSDSWYTCLDEPDNDGFDDHLPELSIGRLVYDSADDIDELEVQVTKIMNYYNWTYEEHRDGEWLGRALLIGHRENDNVEGGLHYINCKERIASKEYELPAPEWIRAYGTEDFATNNFILDQINGAGIGFWNYRGHGSSTECRNWNTRNEDINSAFVSRMENPSRPFIAVQSACLNGNIATFGGDCLLERFQKHDGASVCIHGSVISTYTSGNHFFDEQIFEQWFSDNNIYDLGYAAVTSMVEMVNVWDRTAFPVVGRMNTRAYIWLGDPALEYKLSAPVEPMVQIPDLLPVGVEVIEARVMLRNEPLANARFCIRSPEDEVYLADFTDEEGRVTFELDEPINEVMQLSWMVYHRTAIPVADTILVVDGFGIVQGHVSDFRTGEPIAEARLSLPRFGGGAVTDVDGNFRIVDAPAAHHRIIVSAEGYIPQETEFDLEIDSTVDLNFELKFSLLETRDNEISEHLQQGETSDYEVEFENTGNGSLDWNAGLLYIHEEREPYEVLDELGVSDITNDTRINGVEFVNGVYYVTGGNRNSDPNYFYVISPEGELLDTIRQPLDCAGFGIYDLAWDGEYLWGSANATIYRFNLDGEVESSIIGYLNPNSAIAVDDEGSLWISGTNQLIYNLDQDGNVLASLDNNLDIRALTWNSHAEEGYRLLALVRDEEGMADLYRIDIGNEEIRKVTDLSEEINETPGFGLCLMQGQYQGELELTGVLAVEDDRILRSWHYQFLDDWGSLSAESGTLESEASDRLILSFDTRDYNDIRFEGTLTFENTGRVPLVEVPIHFAIGNVSVVNDENVNVPLDHTVLEAYPNPFNATAQIRFNIIRDGNVDVLLYDISGRLVESISSGFMRAGNHQMILKADRLPSGIYMLAVKTGGVSVVNKLVLMK